MTWSPTIEHRCETDGASQRKVAFVALVLTALIGCRDQSTSGPSNPSLLTAPLNQLLVGEGRVMLDEAGRLILPAPAEGTIPSITEERAESIAALWPGQFGAFILPTLEEAHGASIDMTRLRVCGRTLYVETAYEPSRITGAPEAVLGVLRRAYGPWWMVPLCGPKQLPQIIVSVSAYATDITLDGSKMTLPTSGGEWMRVDAMPLAAPNEFPLTAERAIRLGAARTGSRVAGLAVLVARPLASPTLSLWRIPLERPIRIRTDKRPYGAEVHEIYVGFQAGGGDEPRYFIPGANQPTSELARIPAPSSGLKAQGTVISVEVPVNPVNPTVFEVVTDD
jgi:hypothetical protein